MNQIKPRRKIIRNGKTAPARKNTFRKPEAESDATLGVGGKSYQKAVQSRDKYRELAREALVSGDRVAAEGHFQHADHYNRLISAAHELAEEKSRANAKKTTSEALPPVEENVSVSNEAAVSLDGNNA